MTLCIAAACRHRNRDAVVLGSDFMVEGVSSKADILDKLYWINQKQWPVLISGDDISKAIELKEVYRIELESRTRTINTNDLVDLIHKPLLTQKKRLADQYVSRELGMSYDDFLTKGRDQLPESTRTNILNAVRRLKYKADLIIVVFVEVKTGKGRSRKYKRPLIFTAGDEGLHWCEQFACIGSGYYAADAMLSYREHTETTLGYRAMYHVHEAMAFGADVSPGVGKGTIAIVYDNGKEIIAEQPKGRYRDALRRVFRSRLGPRDVSSLPKLRPRDLTEF